MSLGDTFQFFLGYSVEVVHKFLKIFHIEQFIHDNN